MMFDYLLARETHTHEATPGVYYVTGWNDRIERQECIIVALRIRNDKHAEQLFAVAETITRRLSEETPVIDWSYRLAFVRAHRGLLDWTLQLDPMRITPDEYQRIVAAAEAQS